MNKDYKLFMYIYKNIPEPLNFYLVYKGVKKGYININLDYKKLNKIKNLSKKLKLNIKQTEHYTFVSKKKISDNIDSFDNKFLGYPKDCLSFAFDGRTPQIGKFRSEIKIFYEYESLIIRDTIYGYECNNNKNTKDLLKNAKNIEKVIKNNLPYDFLKVEVKVSELLK